MNERKVRMTRLTWVYAETPYPRGRGTRRARSKILQKINRRARKAERRQGCAEIALALAPHESEITDDFDYDDLCF